MNHFLHDINFVDSYHDIRVSYFLDNRLLCSIPSNAEVITIKDSAHWRIPTSSKKPMFCPEPYDAASVSLTPIMATIFLLQIIAAARGRDDAGEPLWNRRRSVESCFCEGGLPPILSVYGGE
jgi:hypothetical protein